MIGPIIYLCGPMTGLPALNRPAFIAAECSLSDAGYIVINPARNGLPPGAPWINHMRRDIAAMVNAADAVATLPGCESSRGAIAEIGLATALGWPVHTVEQWLELARTQHAAENLTD